MNQSLMTLSPLDGRYLESTQQLRRYFSEFALIRLRVEVEVKWLLFLESLDAFTELHDPGFSHEDREFLSRLFTEFSEDYADEIKTIEGTIRHDVKAVEYFIRGKMDNSGTTTLRVASTFVHFCCTSDDINNAAYAICIRSALHEVMLPALSRITDSLNELISETFDVPLLSMTHGQPATPSTFGKEMANFVVRLKKCIKCLSTLNIYAKFNGAVGNFNSHIVAMPEVDWRKASRSFVEQHLQLAYSEYSSQIEFHDYLAELCDAMCRINTVLIDLCVDCWLYTSRGILRLKVVSSEVGSSTMPHKVNPIDFENAEGNFGVANALLRFYSSKLPISRMQRDLSDSTVLRNLGVAFGHCLVGYKSVQRGLSRISIDTEATHAELENEWKLLAEPIQSVLKRCGDTNSYEKLKEFTRNDQKLTQVAFVEFLEKFDSAVLPQDKKDILLRITPHTYVGLAPQLAKAATEDLGEKC